MSSIEQQFFNDLEKKLWTAADKLRSNIELSGCSYVAHETVNDLDRLYPKKNDLLDGMTGYVGQPGLVLALDSVGYLNQCVGRVSTVDRINDIGYPYCLVRYSAYIAYAEFKAHGSAQANVCGTDLMDFPAMVPNSEVLKIFNAQVAKIISSFLPYHEKSQNLAEFRDTLLPGELLLESEKDAIEGAV